MILIEMTSNPTLRVADLDGIAALARDRGIRLAVDDTLTAPPVIRPFEHGTEIVIHSVTKLLARQFDATRGYVAARIPDLQARIAAFAATLGLTSSRFDCRLADLGLHSFEVRHDRAEANAAMLADAMANKIGVRGVIYPGRRTMQTARRPRAFCADGTATW